MFRKFFPAFSILIFSCTSEKKSAVDLILHNALIYTVDSAFSTCEAFAVKDGSIIATGTSADILGKYDAQKKIDADGQTVFPGFIDAHCHFLSYGLNKTKLDLVGTTSLQQMMEKAIEFTAKKPADRQSLQLTDQTWLLGRGWDQNDWSANIDGSHPMPDNRILDSLFPTRPAYLVRVDGHAALVNSEALKRAGININTKISGGEIVKEKGKLTGVLIDNAMDLVKNFIPSAGARQVEDALMKAQHDCFSVGLTTVDDAGLMKKETDIIDALQKNGKLKMRMYVMMSDSAPNYEHFLKKGPYKSDRLNIRAFKFYADGALGSRGACLKHDYADKPGWKGFLLSPIEHFKKKAAILAEKGFQMCTHCIGDSALKVLVEIYGNYCNEKSERRWRIEHAQVASALEFKNFSKDLIASVQPVHATSDMYWAGERLGKDRLKYAYAYRNFLDAAGLIALGTDFPVEDISPFRTFYAAVVRKDTAGFPPGGFQPENAITREQALKGMTIWAAYSNFEEKEKGSIEPGKLADFIILNTDLMNCTSDRILKTQVLSTYIGGEEVFNRLH